MAKDIVKITDFTENEENRRNEIIAELQGNVPAELKVSDVITANDIQKNVQDTLQEKLEIVSNKLTLWKESLLALKEELLSLESMFNRLNEKTALTFQSRN